MQVSLSAIKRIENAAKKIDGSVSLAQGTPSFSSNPIIQSKVIKAIKKGWVDRYSSVAGLLELRTLICRKLAHRGMFYDPETEIIVTAGVIESLSATLISLIDPRKEVIILTPAYPYYPRIIKMARARPIQVPLSEKDGWSLNVDLLESKIGKNTQAILLCNPNNPTGTVLGKKTLLEITGLAERYNLTLICDDVYEDFYWKEGKLFSLCTIRKYKNRVIRLMSLSKNYALSGWRIGYLAGPENLVKKILVTHDNLVNCAPVVSQYAALAALENEKEILPANLKEYSLRRQLMGRYLEGLKGRIQFSWPDGGYYFFPKVVGVTDTEKFCFKVLNKVGLAVVPGKEFGLGGEGHIRLCCGRSREDISSGMLRLKKYLDSN